MMGAFLGSLAGSVASAVKGGIVGGAGLKKPQSRKDSDDDKDSYKRGGKVRRTGKAKLHKGERVLTKKQARKYDKKRRSK